MTQKTTIAQRAGISLVRHELPGPSGTAVSIRFMVLGPAPHEHGPYVNADDAEAKFKELVAEQERQKQAAAKRKRPNRGMEM